MRTFKVEKNPECHGKYKKVVQFIVQTSTYYYETIYPPPI